MQYNLPHKDLAAPLVGKFTMRHCQQQPATAGSSVPRVEATTAEGTWQIAGSIAQTCRLMHKLHSRPAKQRRAAQAPFIGYRRWVCSSWFVLWGVLLMLYCTLRWLWPSGHDTRIYSSYEPKAWCVWVVAVCCARRPRTPLSEGWDCCWAEEPQGWSCGGHTPALLCL